MGALSASAWIGPSTGLKFDETINYNWWMDQYGNIIGVTPWPALGMLC